MYRKIQTARRFFAVVLLTALFALTLTAPAAFGGKLEEADPDPESQIAPPITDSDGSKEDPSLPAPSVDAAWDPWSWLERGLHTVAEWAANVKDTR